MIPVTVTNRSKRTGYKCKTEEINAFSSDMMDVRSCDKSVAGRLAELDARLGQMLANCTSEQVEAVHAAIELLDDVREQSQILDEWQVTLFESLNECVAVVEKDNLISYVNPLFCKVFGYRSDEILGKPYSMLVRNWMKIEADAKPGRAKWKLLRAEVRHKNNRYEQVKIKIQHYTDPTGARIRSLMQIMQ
ncbi:MAG: PAS domain-containing protein, partial [Chlorobiales bacterium]|nr:PAS domain-containing protein [Chlorobiales bacterium]